MDPQQQSREQSTGRLLPWLVVCLAFLSVAVIIGYPYGITLWDWLKLLVVPAVIAGGGLWFNRQQRERELEIAERQRKQDSLIAQRRTQDEALQAYLDQMSGMLIPGEGQPSLYEAQPEDRLSSVARARTLTVLPRLNYERKGRVLQFLYESGLINKARPVLNLQGADLNEAFLRGTFQSRADLSGAFLSEVFLFQADLSGADLSGADLSGAFLRESDLSGADLSGAFLSGVFLFQADLSEADLSGATGITSKELEQQARSLEGTTMPNGQKYEDWLKDREARKEDEKNR